MQCTTETKPLLPMREMRTVNSNVQPNAPVTLTARYLLLRYASPSGHVATLTRTCATH